MHHVPSCLLTFIRAIKRLVSNIVAVPPFLPTIHFAQFSMLTHKLAERNVLSITAELERRAKNVISSLSWPHCTQKHVITLTLGDFTGSSVEKECNKKERKPLWLEIHSKCFYFYDCQPMFIPMRETRVKTLTLENFTDSTQEKEWNKKRKPLWLGIHSERFYFHDCQPKFIATGLSTNSSPPSSASLSPLTTAAIEKRSQG